MYNYLICIVLLSFLISCKDTTNKSKAELPVSEVNYTLITDSSWGLIKADDTFDDIKKKYGELAVKDERICGPECIDSIDVTKLFPDKKGEAIIYWQDSFYHKKIGFITSYSDSAEWHTADGLRIGSPVGTLLKINGQPIKFWGFGWDYGGGIISYNNGAFEKSSIDFDLDKQYGERPDTSTALLGDQELSTDSPVVQKEIDKIKIRKISLSFYKEK